jgi:DNA-directed RNA polymerase specialized sigma subunit
VVVALANLRFADALAGGVPAPNVPLVDLQQVARGALVRAVQEFPGDPDAAGFIAFAAGVVRGELRRALRDAGWGNILGVAYRGAAHCLRTPGTSIR